MSFYFLKIRPFNEKLCCFCKKEYLLKKSYSIFLLKKIKIHSVTWMRYKVQKYSFTKTSFIMKTKFFTLLAFLMTSTLIGQSLEDGLVAQYSFDKVDYQNDQFSDLTANNNYINGYDLSFFDDDNNGNSYSAIATGYPLSTAYMAMNENQDLSTINGLSSMTISFWTIRSSYGTPSGYNPIINIEADNGTAYNLEVNRETNRIYLTNVANGQVNAFTKTITFFSADEYHHIAISIDYVTYRMKIYFDGVLEGESDLAVLQAPQNPVVTFGKYRNGEHTEFTTCFDNMYIHNRVLSEDEIAMAMASPFTSIENNILESDQVTVFPNPAKDISFLNIDFPNATSKTLVDISDAQGRLVRTEKLNSNQINISQLAKGVYFLKIKTEEGSYVKKVLIE